MKSAFLTLLLALSALADPIATSIPPKAKADDVPWQHYCSFRWQITHFQCEPTKLPEIDTWDAWMAAVAASQAAIKDVTIWKSTFQPSSTYSLLDFPYPTDVMDEPPFLPTAFEVKPCGAEYFIRAVGLTDTGDVIADVEFSETELVQLSWIYKYQGPDFNIKSRRVKLKLTQAKPTLLAQTEHGAVFLQVGVEKRDNDFPKTSPQVAEPWMEAIMLAVPSRELSTTFLNETPLPAGSTVPPLAWGAENRTDMIRSEYSETGLGIGVDSISLGRRFSTGGNTKQGTWELRHSVHFPDWQRIGPAPGEVHAWPAQFTVSGKTSVPAGTGLLGMASLPWAWPGDTLPAGSAISYFNTAAEPDLGQFLCLAALPEGTLPGQNDGAGFWAALTLVPTGANLKLSGMLEFSKGSHAYENGNWQLTADASLIYRTSTDVQATASFAATLALPQLGTDSKFSAEVGEFLPKDTPISLTLGEWSLITSLRTGGTLFSVWALAR